MNRFRAAAAEELFKNEAEVVAMVAHMLYQHLFNYWPHGQVNHEQINACITAAAQMVSGRIARLDNGK